MSKYICVEDCKLKLSNGNGTVEITTPPFDKLKINDKKAYSGILQIKISGYTGGPIDVPSSGKGVGTLTPTSKQCKIGGKPAVLEGDKSIPIVVNGQKSTPQGPVPVTVPVTVTIEKAGQEDVTGD